MTTRKKRLSVLKQHNGVNSVKLAIEVALRLLRSVTFNDLSKVLKITIGP